MTQLIFIIRCEPSFMSHCLKVQIETSRIVASCELCSQRVELLCWSVGHGCGGFQLSLAKRMHDFHTRDRTPGRPKGLKAEHGTREPFHRAMVLLHNII